MTTKSVVMGIFVLLILLVYSPQAFSDSDSIVLDYSDDFRSYARTVAELNQPQSVSQIQNETGVRGRGVVQLAALLCKTDGREIDFARVSPSYVIAGPRNCFTLFFSSSDLCQAAVRMLTNTDGIVYAEPDCEVHASSNQSADIDSASQSFHSWGAEKMNIGLYINYAGSWGSGSASIAVVDSGVYPHPLIKGKLLSGGYDYVDNDDDPSNDLFGHGTNVAGVIADCTAGQPVNIYPIRVLNSNGGGKMSNVVNAVREAKQRGVTIINLSLESSVMSEALDDAILEAVSSGIIVVVAAGNSSTNTSNVCPAHLTNSGVIVVGSAEGSNGAYTISSYSNYGSSVDVYAFGTGISCCSISGGFSSETGTSMAAPHISSLCALMHIIHPGLSPAQAENRLKRASLGIGAIIVPDSSLMIPASEGFSLTSVTITMDDVLPMPLQAYPLTANEAISYSSSDEKVVTIENGTMCAKGIGRAAITVSCKGFEDTTFMVTVTESCDISFTLPVSIEIIDDEAFYGLPNLSRLTVPPSVHRIGNSAFDDCINLRIIEIPDSVSEIGDNRFSDAIIICSQGSVIQSYAEGLGLQYIAHE